MRTVLAGRCYANQITAVADYNSSRNNYLRIPLGLFTLKVPKESAGEHFEGLQMLTSLLAPKGSRSARPLVEDISTGEERVKPCPPCLSVCLSGLPANTPF